MSQPPHGSLHGAAARLRKLKPWVAAAWSSGSSGGRPAREGVLLWAGLAGIAACGAVLLVWEGAPAPDPRTASRMAGGQASAGLPSAAVPVPAVTSAEPSKSSESRIAPEGLDLGPYLIRPPFIILDGATFGPEHARPTRLSGIAAPPATAVCFDRAGQLWACRLQSRAALSRLISKRDVACVPSGPPTADVVEATCRIDDVDLGQALLDQGFARAASPAGPLAAREAAARQAETGLWNGGWRLR